MWVITNSDEYRGLESTGIFVWDERYSEHLARLAAEIGDVETESLCDRVIAGEASEDALIDLVEADDRYRGWMLRGRYQGWTDRATAGGRSAAS